jgi:hypothetical protein
VKVHFAPKKSWDLAILPTLQSFQLLHNSENKESFLFQNHTSEMNGVAVSSYMCARICELRRNEALCKSWSSEFTW